MKAVKIFLIIGLLLFSRADPQENRISIFAEGFEKICDQPEVYVCDHFLSDEECEHIIQVALPALAPSTVADPNSPRDILDSRRSSQGTFLSRSDDVVIAGIQQRIAQITAIPVENGENLQVLYYGIGAEYQPHYDYFDPSTPGGSVHFNRGGQRVATILMYLNTPEEGGETIFPKARLKVVPVKGRAVLFYNTDLNGKPDSMSLHGGAPVIQGEKWLMTRWLREDTFY